MRDMTDNEIIKALECCTQQAGCNGCPLLNSIQMKYRGGYACAEEMRKCALDLINRLQAENERLNEKVDFVGDLKNIRKQIKAEAYKEFAERLKEKAYTYSDITGYQSTVVDVNEIDGVYEEMVAREEAENGAIRRSKIGTGDRSEKIRTYNYPQNRLTDHRINYTVMHLDRMMEGDIDELIESLIAEDERMRLEESNAQ